MINLFRGFNQFIGLKDGEETAPWSDLLYFYGMLMFTFVGTIYFVTKIFSF